MTASDSGPGRASLSTVELPRALLRHPRGKTRVAHHKCHPITRTPPWVEDLGQRTRALPSEVVEKAVRAAEEQRLAEASKSVVPGAKHDIAAQVVAQLARQDIHILCTLTGPTDRRRRRCAKFGGWTTRAASAIIS